MSSAFAQLTHTDGVLIQAYLQGESEFQQVGNNLQFSLVTLYQWLALPYIAEVIKHLKSLELDRAQIIAARARNTLIQKLNTTLEAAASTLAQTQNQEQSKTPEDAPTKDNPSPTSPTSPAATFFMKVATLLSRLATFKPSDLKAATQLITKVAESNQPTQHA